MLEETPAAQRGEPVIYVLCDKAIDGTIPAALICYYMKLVGNLMDWGFKMNPYEPCYWNKIINKEWFTIIFHADDLKQSHKDKEQVSDVISNLESLYATVDPMAVHRGKLLHHYLGIIIGFRVQREVHQITHV